MKYGILYLTIVFTLTGALTGCKPSVPAQYIQPDEMEDILYDYYIGQSMANSPDRNGSADFQRQVNYLTVLKKYGVTPAEFDSSLVYYYIRADRFVKIYDKVQERLNNKALELGASLGDVNRFTAHSLTGDTADIWMGERHFMLLPHPPYHVVQFVQKADTAFRAGDSFLLSFDTSFLVQSGSKNMTAYLSVTYANDSVISQQVSAFSQGNSTIRIPVCDNKVKEIKGFFYMPPRQETDNVNDMRMLFINRVQLIRFHQQRQKGESQERNGSNQPMGSVRPDSAKTMPKDTNKYVRRLGERPIPVPVLK